MFEKRVAGQSTGWQGFTWNSDDHPFDDLAIQLGSHLLFKNASKLRRERVEHFAQL